MKKLYSAGQVLGGSYLGGPFAAIYLLKKDFEAIGKQDIAKKTLIFGLIGIMILMPILYFLPENFPNTAIPLSYSLAAYSVALKNKLRKSEIQESGIYERHSNWRVVGIALISIIAFVIIAAISIFVLDVALFQSGLLKSRP